MKKLFLLALLFFVPSIHAQQTQHNVLLQWVQSTSTSIVGNKVYRAINTGGPYISIYNCLTLCITYTDTNVIAGFTYYYTVTAYDKVNESGKSNEAKTTIPTDITPPLAAPTQLTATPGGEF